MADKDPDELVSIELIATIDVPNVVLLRFATLRFHPSGGGYGSPYTFACLLTAVDDIGWISALAAEDENERFTAEHYREIIKAAHAFGLPVVEFERRTRGKHRIRRRLTS